MAATITPRIKPAAFSRRQPGADFLVQDQRQPKPGGFIANVAAMDELIDFTTIAAQVDAACPRLERRKGGRPPYPTQVMRPLFIQSLYNLSDEVCEYQLLDRMSIHSIVLDGSPTVYVNGKHCAPQQRGGHEP